MAQHQDRELEFVWEEIGARGSQADIDELARIYPVYYDSLMEGLLYGGYTTLALKYYPLLIRNFTDDHISLALHSGSRDTLNFVLSRVKVSELKSPDRMIWREPRPDMVPLYYILIDFLDQYQIAGAYKAVHIMMEHAVLLNNRNLAGRCYKWYKEHLPENMETYMMSWLEMACDKNATHVMFTLVSMGDIPSNRLCLICRQQFMYHKY
jgi:hypothetical protein